jgi:hypothetical protein
MNAAKRKTLEAAGWRFGDAEDFLEDIEMKPLPTLALLAAAALPTIGCGPPANDTATAADAAPPAPFLGVPEDREQKIEDAPEGAQSALRGITTMTAVQTVGYEEYQRFKKDGKIKKEETRGRFVYFATDDKLCVGFPDGVSTPVPVTNRYRAAVPEN